MTNYIREVMFRTAFNTFVRKERIQEDFFQEGAAEMEPTLDAKRDALLA